ncbi:MAG TPA: DegT/DnrJ/EryC1/StrS aminotransferase family protein [Solirubrobacteraceae bacterium]|jgi:dTDP-4-amino-4,6-dideoxygalactose transaminase
MAEPEHDPRPATVREPGRSAFLDLSRPDIGDDEIAEILDSLRAGWLTTGPKVERLQEGLQDYLGVEHVQCLTSCTAGLMLGLRTAGIGPGDEVLVPTLTFVSCANAIEQVGARPVFVDADPATGLLDLDHAESRIGPATRGMMIVHLTGRPVDMERVNELRDRHELVVMEDAAHAIGAEWAGRRVGAWGNHASFSFHATKNMTTFEGGALVVRDAETADRVAQLARHGLSRSAWTRHGRAAPDRYDVVEPGFKLAMNDISGAVGIHQLRRLDENIAKRARLAEAYDRALEGLPLRTPPGVAPGARHAHHVYAVQVDDDAPLGRDELIEGLLRRNIGSSVHFRPIHTYSYYAERYGLELDDLPVARRLGDRLLSLPLFPRMTLDDVDDVARALGDLLG